MSETTPQLPPHAERLAAAYGFGNSPDLEDQVQTEYGLMCAELRADTLNRFEELGMFPDSQRARYWIRYNAPIERPRVYDRALNVARTIILMVDSRLSAARPIFRIIANDEFLRRQGKTSIRLYQAEDFSLSYPDDAVLRIGMFSKIGRRFSAGGPKINQVNDTLEIRGYTPHTPEESCSTMLTDPLGKLRRVTTYPLGHPQSQWDKLAAITAGRELLDETAAQSPKKFLTDFVQR